MDSGRIDEARRAVADELFEGHDFTPWGFEATSGWTYDSGGGECEWSRPVFLLDPDRPNGDSEKATFTVRFAHASDAVVDSHCILNGEIVGKPASPGLTP